MEINKPTIRVSSSGPIYPLTGYLRLSPAFIASKMVGDFTGYDFTGYDFTDYDFTDKGIPIT